MSPWAVTLSWQHSYISNFVMIHKPSKLGQTELFLVCDRSSLAVPVCRTVFVRFSLGGQSFDWRLATIAGMEVAKLELWNSLLN